MNKMYFKLIIILILSEKNSIFQKKYHAVMYFFGCKKLYKIFNFNNYI